MVTFNSTTHAEFMVVFPQQQWLRQCATKLVTRTLPVLFIVNVGKNPSSSLECRQYYRPVTW